MSRSFSAAYRSDKVVELRIPTAQRHVDPSESASGKKWKSWCSCCSWPTSNQMRWPVQVGAAAGLTSFLLTFLPPSEEFFNMPAVIGTAITVVVIEGTAGGSLRRGWLMAIFGCFGALAAFGLFVACSEIAHGVHARPMPYLIAVSAAVLVIPFSYIRYKFPTVNVGSNFGLSTAETVLLASFASTQELYSWDRAWKRAIASVIGPLCSALVSQFVMRKAARPTATTSLATILTSIAEILDRLASSLGPDGSTFAYSQKAPFILNSKRPDLPSNAIYPSSAQPAEGEPAASHLYSAFGVHSMDVNHSSLTEGIKKCQGLLAGQKALMESASQEISWRKPHRFPFETYTAVLNEIRNLFFHISSLVFALNLNVSTAFSSLSLAGKPVPRSRSAPPSKFMRRICSDGDLRPFQLPSILSVSSQTDLSIAMEEDMIGKVARHLAAALCCVAECLKMRRKIDSAVRLQIQIAMEAIGEMDTFCQRQRLTFAEVILNCSKWSSKPDAEPPDWMAAIGISSSTFLQLNENDKAVYWDAYWLGRDRTSIASATLRTLTSSLINLCTVVDDYVIYGSLDETAKVIQLLPLGFI